MGTSELKKSRWAWTMGAVTAARYAAARHAGESGFALAIAYANQMATHQQPVDGWRRVRVSVDGGPAITLSPAAKDGWIGAEPGAHRIVVRPHDGERSLLEVTLNAVVSRPSVVVLYPARGGQLGLGVTRVGYRVW